MDTSHLNTLELNLSHTRTRLGAAKTPGERAVRAVHVAQLEKEIACERAFLGMDTDDSGTMSDDDLLAELMK